MTEEILLNIDSGKEWKVKKYILQCMSFQLGMRVHDVCKGLQPDKIPHISLGDETDENVNSFVESITFFSCLQRSREKEVPDFFKKNIARAYPLLRKYECHGLLFYVKSFLSSQTSEEYIPSILSVLSVETDYDWVTESMIQVLKKNCLKGDGLFASCCQSKVVDLRTDESQLLYYDEIGSRMRRIPFPILARFIV